MQHNCREGKKNWIDGLGGLIFPKVPFPGKYDPPVAWYTSQTFSSGGDAANKLALPSVPEFYISTLMYPKTDKLDPWPEGDVAGKDWGNGEGFRPGGGSESRTSEIIWVHHPLRANSGWIPYGE